MRRRQSSHGTLHDSDDLVARVQIHAAKGECWLLAGTDHVHLVTPTVDGGLERDISYRRELVQRVIREEHPNVDLARKVELLPTPPIGRRPDDPIFGRRLTYRA